MANDLTINQISTILNSVVKQATGKNVLTPTNSGEFVAVAQMGLKTGYDTVLNSISQVLSKTVFSVRPYTRKFKGLEVSEQRYGNIVRKLNIADKDFKDDARYNLTDGVAVDMYQVNKPNILQMNFYGQETYSRDLTIFRDQLDVAFSSAEEFGRFITMTMTNTTDLLEQARENLARGTVANFIGGKLLGDTGNVVHLLTEYNSVTGLTLTDETVYQPENFRPFIQWAYARMSAISELMTERSELFHINITGKPISRHSPKNRQKAYVFGQANEQINTMVLSNTFNDTYLKIMDKEIVNFWQSIQSPDSIDVVPTYLKPDGTLTTPETSVKQSKVFAVLFDDEAMGYTLVNQWSATTPFNARGGYSNIFWHETCRYWNDFTENGVIFLLD